MTVRNRLDRFLICLPIFGNYYVRHTYQKMLVSRLKLTTISEAERIFLNNQLSSMKLWKKFVF